MSIIIGMFILVFLSVLQLSSTLAVERDLKEIRAVLVKMHTVSEQHSISSRNSLESIRGTIAHGLKSMEYK